jgi:hypothetical protein
MLTWAAPAASPAIDWLQTDRGSQSRWISDKCDGALAQGAPLTPVAVYLNQAGARGWTRQVLGGQGNHSMRIAHLDEDGSPSLSGARTIA